MSGWIGVDLDGTLAEYDHWQGENHIGRPVPKMIIRVKQWIKEGKDVRILTARAFGDRPEAIRPIKKWCKENVGVELPVTCMKDYEMIELWDDRCVQVISNTGLPIRDLLGRV